MVCARHFDCDKKFSNKLIEENKKGFYFDNFNLKTGEYAKIMKEDYWSVLEVLIKKKKKCNCRYDILWY